MQQRKSKRYINRIYIKYISVRYSAAGINKMYWQEKPIIPTRAAAEEMSRHKVDLYKVSSILERGFDCGLKRKAGIYEKCVRLRRNRVLKVVVEDRETFWRLRHVGSFRT
jgi:hypothetical protein